MWTASGESSSTEVTIVLDAAAGLALDLVGEAQDGDHQRDVGLDGGDDLAGGHALLRDHAQETVAGLGEGGERLERLEGGREAAAVTFVVTPRGTGA